MELFKLLGTIAVDNSGANSSIDETSEKASSFSDKLKSGISTAGKWGTAIVGGATAAAAGLAKFAQSSAATADNIDKMSQKIGISRQAYQELDFICSQSGTSVDTLQMGMKTLTSAMDGAASGTATNIEQFEKLGVSVTNADGSLRSQEEVMWETMAALQAMDNQTEKARLATELFGRSGSELMPLLNGASGSIDQMRQQANDLGLVLSDDLVNSGVSMTDTLDQMQRAFGAIVTKLGAALMPILETVAKYIIDMMPTISGLFERLSPIITQLFDGLLPPLLDLCETLLPVIFDLLETLIPVVSQIIEAVLPVIINLLNMLLPPIIQIIKMVLPLLISLIEPLLPLLEPIFALLQPFIDLLMMLLEPLIQLLNMILPPLIQVISWLIEGVLSVLQPILEWYANMVGTVLSGVITAITELIGWCAEGFKGAWEGIKTAWSAVVNFFKGIWDGIKNIFSGVGNWFKNIFKGAFDGIKNVFGGIADWFKNIFNKIADVVKAPINFIIKGLNTLIRGANKISFGVPDWVPVIGGKKFGFNIKEIPQLAKGAVVTEPTVAEIGEDGDEAIVPLENNTGWIQKVANRLHEFSIENRTSFEDIVPVDNFITAMKMEVGQRIGNLEILVAELLAVLKEMFPQLMEAFDVEMVLDDGTLVAKLAPKMDRQLGLIYKRKERG